MTADRDEMMRAADELVVGAHAASTPSGAMFSAPVRAADRLEGFARSFLLASIRMAGSDGHPEAWCLHYRDALAAGVTEGGLDAWPRSGRRPHGVALARHVIAHFLEQGAVADGLLTLGWHRPRASVLQSYNTLGSPLWAAMGFLGLLLPEDHRA